MKRVYVAGPYTIGDAAQNVARAMRAGNVLLEAGYAPYVPHLFHFMHMLYPHGWDMWLRIDMSWLEKSDALIRLPGESEGADREVQFARENNIPVLLLDDISDDSWIYAVRVLFITPGELL